MLPDFPEIKQTFASRITRLVDHKRAETLHLFNDSPTTILHEGGDTLTFVREDGTEHQIEMKRLSVQFSIAKDERLTPEQFRQKIENLAMEMGKKQLGLIYEELDRKVTNVVDARDEPLSPEHIIQALKTIDIDFDSNGQPKLPTIFVHPDQYEKYRRANDEIKSNRDLRRRFDEIIRAKKEEWRVRESHRKLVG